MVAMSQSSYFWLPGNIQRCEELRSLVTRSLATASGPPRWTTPASAAASAAYGNPEFVDPAQTALSQPFVGYLRSSRSKEAASERRGAPCERCQHADFDRMAITFHGPELLHARSYACEEAAQRFLCIGSAYELRFRGQPRSARPFRGSTERALRPQARGRDVPAALVPQAGNSAVDAVDARVGGLGQRGCAKFKQRQRWT